MCGFTAMLRLDGNPADRETVRRMTDVIRHRGPDDSGEYFAGPVGFGFRRLSILDLTPAGHQPMTTDDDRYTIVFNGEIYNYRELRRELEAGGHRFHSTGDTEVLLHAYREWGTSCLDRLNGMWAFVIHDKARQVLFGARDRFGIKPLYMHRDTKRVLFASEIKALRASGSMLDDVNWEVAANFLLLAKFEDCRHTFYRGIEQISAASAFELKLDGEFRQWRYWQLDAEHATLPADPAARFAELFEDAIRLHMRSDVPVGVHLSGGLDSTSIICAAARVRSADGAQDPIQAFTFHAPEFDESSFVNDTLRQTGAVLHRLESDPVRFWSSLDELMWFQDEPFHSIYLLVAYELMRMTASSGIKVVLNGQGADETLAGYPSYFRDYWNSHLRAGRIASTWNEIGAFVSVHGGSRARLFALQCKHLLQGSLAVFGAYRHVAAKRLLQSLADDDWFTPQLRQHVDVHRRDENPSVDLDSALRRAIDVQPLPLYLRLEDRNSMAHSIEARVPFLDHRLVSFAFSLPPQWRMRGPWNKYLLREAMRGRIPESVRGRAEKFGFPVPVRDWMSKALYQPARELVSSRSARERGIYKVENILRDIERHRRGEIDVGSKIFNVLQFEIWSAQQRAPLEHRAPTPVAA